MSNIKPITVILAEDHVIVREGLAAVCQKLNLQVLGECADGLAALEMIRALRPDFALLDLHMPKLSGLEVVRRVREAAYPTRCIMLTFSRNESLIREALKAGADGYLLKEGPSRHLADAISYIRDGGRYISPLLKEANLFAPRDTAKDDPLAPLSPRERDVFSHLVNAHCAKEIATLLGISPKTVDTYRTSLMHKLKLPDLVSLVKFAIQNGLTST